MRAGSERACAALSPSAAGRKTTKRGVRLLRCNSILEAKHKNAQKAIHTRTDSCGGSYYKRCPHDPPPIFRLHTPSLRVCVQGSPLSSILLPPQLEMVAVAAAAAAAAASALISSWETVA